MQLSRVSLLQNKYKNDIESAIESCLQKADFINGNAVLELENTLKISGFNFAVTTASGSDALYIALSVLNLPKNCDILTTSFSFIATAEAILRVNKNVIFADINDYDFNINLHSIKKHITPKTKAIIAVELFGKMLDDNIITFCIENDLFLIIDCAQSFRANIINENFKHEKIIAITSFFPTKILGCYGDGGAVFCNDEKLDEKMRVFKNHGIVEKYNSNTFGILSRLDTLQAHILLVKIKDLENEINERIKIAQKYNNALSNNKNITLPALQNCIFAQYSIMSKKREKIKQIFINHAVPFAIYYPIILPYQKVFTKNLKRQFIMQSDDFAKNNGLANNNDSKMQSIHHFKNAINASENIISLPLDINDEEIDFIASILKSL